MRNDTERGVDDHEMPVESLLVQNDEESLSVHDVEDEIAVESLSPVQQVDPEYQFKYDVETQTSVAVSTIATQTTTIDKQLRVCLPRL